MEEAQLLAAKKTAAADEEAAKREAEAIALAKKKGMPTLQAILPAMLASLAGSLAMPHVCRCKMVFRLFHGDEMFVNPQDVRWCWTSWTSSEKQAAA